MDRFKRLTSYLSVVLLYIFINSGLPVFAQNWPAGIHDPSSIVKCKDRYWIFGTGDGIYSMYSTDLVTWKSGPTPFTKTDFPAWILNYAKTSTAEFEGNFWAPDIIYMNDRYYLYYSCSVWGTMSSCIGVVVNKTLDPADPEFEWVDQGDIGIYSNGGYINAIDPSVMRGPDNKVWLTYGSFNRDAINVYEIDTITGRPKPTGRSTIANSWTGPGSNNYGEGEGACQIYHDGYYYLFYNKGGCCNGIASTYYIVMGRSTSPRGPFRDKAGKAMRVIGSPSGGTLFFRHDNSRGLDDRYYGPGHVGYFKENGIEYITFHYYSPNGYYPSETANYMGGPTLGFGMIEWGEDGWPSISFDFLDKGYYSLKNALSSKALDAQNHSINSTDLYQYAYNYSMETQKWLFTPLGTGEYTIRSYADSTRYIEATGNNNEESIRLTSSYTGAVNQKFRLVQSPNGKTLIYPSTKDRIFEIPNANTIDYQVKLWSNTNSDCQRWFATPYEETFAVSLNNVAFMSKDTIFRALTVTGTASWQITVEDPSWLIFSPSKGYGEKQLLVLGRANNTGVARTNTMKIRTLGGQEAVVNFTQAADTNTALEKNHALQFEAYPNPSNGMIQLVCTADAVYSVFDNAGREVLSGKTGTKTSVLDLSQQNAGIYFIRVTGKNASGIKKLVIK
ncbi:family 43 glycosylhydrolase [Saccharicrinis sp. FJH54]|uniref:family 43 glycosylhydrolase n=1 Tax=Saccharicrinis sp. FJH54 TaxID=3344665 RepID=UPI0035D50ECF